MEKDRIEKIIRVGFAVIVFWIAASKAEAGERCYVSVSCAGDLNPISTNLHQHTYRIEELGVTFYYPLPAGQPYPSADDLARSNPTRVQDFDARCNQARYSRLPLDPDINKAWKQDSRYLTARMGYGCMPAWSYSDRGQPCTYNSDCYPGADLVCSGVSKSCVQTKPSTPPPKLAN